MIVVVKIGGALIAENFEKVVDDISNIYQNKKDKYRLVLVHGGGAQIDTLFHLMNKKPKYFKTPSGFLTRYTDQEAMEVAIMALGGKNNKRLVEALQKKKVNAFGFTGIDGGIVRAKRKNKILVMKEDKRIMKHGEYSGNVKSVKKELLKYLLEKNYLPVIGSLGMSENGEIVNLDGDRVASYIAHALGADILISLTNVEGIYREIDDKGSLIKSLKKDQLENLMEELVGGMKKKAYAALEALDLNIKKVVIGSGLGNKPIYKALEKENGTVILNE